jgi:hypothetical protein
VTLRPEYMLGHSVFNEFLFAPAGSDEAGQDVTVLSVLARSGLDPWTEAARLADLPKESAAQGVAALLRRENARTPDAYGVASRLVDLLPHHDVPPIPVPIPDPVHAPQHPSADIMKSRPPLWLICVVAAVAWFCLLSYMKPDPAFEPPTTTVTTK